MTTLVDLVLDGLVSSEDGAEVGAPPALVDALHAAVVARAPTALRDELDALRNLVDALIGRGHVEAASTIVDTVAEARAARPTGAADGVDRAPGPRLDPTTAHVAPRLGAAPPAGARSLLAVRAGR